MSSEDYVDGYKVGKKVTAKEIFKLLDHEIYRAEYKNKKLMIEFTDYEKIKVKFLQEIEK